MTPEETLDWLAQEHQYQCKEVRPIQDWIRKMKSQLPAQPKQEPTGMLHIDRLDQWLDASLKERKHRAWVDLTDEEMWNAPTGGSDIINLDYARNVLALAKEKNT